MRLGNIFKYLFIIFVIAIVVFAWYTINNNNTKDQETVIEEEQKQDTTRSTSINVGITNYDTMNPYITNNREILYVDTLIFEPLYTITSDYHLENCLAQDSSNVGNNTYIIKTNTSVNFSNGQTLTSKDIEFSINKLKGSNSVYRSNVEHIASTEIIDATTIRLNLDAEIPFFEYYLTFPIMPASYYEGEEFFSSGKTPIGSGKYSISEMGEREIILRKNASYRKANDESLNVETIILKKFDSKGEEFNSFKISNIDISLTSNMNYTNYIGTLGFNEYRYSGRDFTFLAFNTADEFISDVNLRRAIDKVVDKGNIVANVNASYQVSKYPLDYGNYLYQGDKSYSVDANEAREILLSNGYTFKSNKCYKDGKRVELKISVQEGNWERVRTAELIKESIENLGIKVDIEKINDEKYYTYINNKDYQMLITGTVNSYSPNLNYYFGQYNIFNYTNEEIIGTLNSVETTTPEADLKDKYQRIYNIYNEDLPFIGLYRNQMVLLTTQNLVGKITPNNYNLYYNINSWYRK